MVCTKCGQTVMDGAAFCPHCGAKLAQDEPRNEAPIYQADVKTLTRSGRLVVYRDRTEFVTSSVQKATFYYTGLVSVKKNLSNGIDFLTEDGRTETCPADRKCVHEALVHIEQATRSYLEKRKEVLLSQGIRYSFPSSQGFLNDGILNLSDRQAEFRAKSGKSEVISYGDVKSVSASGATLDFTLFGGGTRSYAVSKELRDEVLAFVTQSVAPYLAQRKADLLAQGIYVSSCNPDGGTLDIRADRAEYRGRSGQVESAVAFPDIRTVSAYGGMLELALTDGTSRSFPIEEDVAAEALAFIKKAIEPYVEARTVGFDTAFGVDERIEFNGERGVFHLIRQGGKEITCEWPMEALARCEWTEDKKLTALGSVVSGGLDLFQRAAKAAGSQAGGETEEKLSGVNVAMTIHGDREEQPQRVCFGRSSIGMGRTDRKYIQCLEEWAGLSEYLRIHCPACELVEPAVPEPGPEPEPTPREGAPAFQRTPEGPERREPAVGQGSVPPVPEGAARRDDLGVAKYIDGVARFIGNCATPMTIAFQGNRGSGKNSALGILFRQLEERYGGRLFWLNARQFPKNGSGEELSLLVGKVLGGVLGGEGAGAKQAGNFLTGLAGLATGIIAGDASIGKEIAGGVLNKNAGNPQEDPSVAFSKQVAAKTRGEDGKLIFFLDGLEQLEPGRAVELLEAMGDFFECKGCVFVVTAESGDILRGARQRYEENKARTFFDDMFKMTFRVPASSFSVQGYARGKLEDMGVRTGDQEELELYAALIQSSVGRGTEAIDRLFTSFQLLKDLTDEAVYEDRYKRLALFALLCMQTRFREVYDHAMEQKDDVTPQFLAGLCGELAWPGEGSRSEEEQAAYGDFGRVLARVVNLDGRKEMSPSECQAFAEVLELSGITSR